MFRLIFQVSTQYDQKPSLQKIKHLWLNFSYTASLCTLKNIYSKKTWQQMLLL